MLSGYLAIICGAGVLAVWISGTLRKFPIPIVVAEIVIGIAIGKAGLAWLPPPDPATAATLKDLSGLGFLFLMFLVGTEMPLRHPGLEKALGKSSLAVALTFSFAALLGFLVLSKVTNLNNPYIFTILLASSSAAVMEPMVREKKLAGPVVLVARLWIALADMIAIIALPFAIAPDRLDNALIGSGVAVVCAIVALFSMKYFRSTKWGERLRLRSKENGHALDFRMSLTILFVISWIAHDMFGVSNSIAGFAAGAVAALIGQPRRFTKQLIGAAEGFFVPIYFVMLGTMLSFGALFRSPENIILALAIAGSTTLVHLVVARIVRLPAAAVGMTTAAQLGVPAAIAALGMQQGALDSVQAAALVAASLMTICISTGGMWLLAKHSVPAEEPEKKHVHCNQTDCGHDDDHDDDDK